MGERDGGNRAHGGGVERTGLRVEQCVEGGD